MSISTAQRIENDRLDSNMECNTQSSSIRTVEMSDPSAEATSANLGHQNRVGWVTIGWVIDGLCQRLNPFLNSFVQNGGCLI